MTGEFLLCININSLYPGLILRECGYFPRVSGFISSPVLFTANHWMAFFLAELIAAILVLFGAYEVLDAWIARVSREEREALEAGQQAMMEGQQEGRHVSH